MHLPVADVLGRVGSPERLPVVQDDRDIGGGQGHGVPQRLQLMGGVTPQHQRGADNDDCAGQQNPHHPQGANQHQAHHRQNQQRHQVSAGGDPAGRGVVDRGVA